MSNISADTLDLFVDILDWTIPVLAVIAVALIAYLSHDGRADQNRAQSPRRAASARVTPPVLSPSVRYRQRPYLTVASPRRPSHEEHRDAA